MYYFYSKFSLCALLVAAFGAIGTTDGVFTIQLDKQYIPVKRGNRIIMNKTVYFGTIYIGFPYQQNFTMVFDTGSAHLLVPSSACSSETCRNHRRYDYNRSASAVPIDADGVSVAGRPLEQHDRVNVVFGTGEIEGPFVYDTVCLDPTSRLVSTAQLAPPKSCVRSRVIHATLMSDAPFNEYAFDGVLGLSLPSLAVHEEFNFFGEMIKNNEQLSQPQFGFFLSRDDSTPSEISFGGHNERRIASELRYVPVVKPELGYWQIAVKGVRVGQERLPFCDDGSCVAIVDTGTSLLGVPKQSAERLNTMLARKATPNSVELDCRKWPGPELAFDLGGGLEVILGPEDYSKAMPLLMENSTSGASQSICRASLLPIKEEFLAENVFIFGEPFLRRYYTAFDFAKFTVGFAEAMQPNVVPA